MTDDHLRITIPAAADQDGRLQAMVEVGATSHAVHFQSKDIRLTPNHEALIAAALLPGMVTGNDLAVNGPVSHRFLNALPVICDIYHSWRPDLAKVAIQGAVPVLRAGTQPGRVGLFFSGGVDSFYSLLKNREEITDLIYIRGINRPAIDKRVDERTSALVHRVAAEFGKAVIEIETDVRWFLAAHKLSWLYLAHGPAMVSAGHLLYPELARIYIAATYSYDQLGPLGTHPLLDPLWSTEGLEFVHDGCEARRLEKVGVVAGSEIALQTLRVCDQGPLEALNCGRCEKCGRTMLMLLACGALERCQTFGAELDLRVIARTIMDTDRKCLWAEDTLKALHETGEYPQIAAALRKSVRRSRRWLQRPPLAVTGRATVRRGLRFIRRLLRPRRAGKAA